jgi:sugar lactone lactonase YvrE
MQYYSRTLPADFSSGRYAAVLAMGTNLDPIRDQLSGYTGNKFRLNWWYPEDYKQLTWSTLLPGNWEPAKVLRYVLSRDLVNPPPPPTPALAAREFYFYVRNDLVGVGSPPAGAVAAPPASPAAPVVVSEPLPVESSTVLGRPNNTPVLRDPKDVAIGRDGRIYVADGANATVTVLNPDGTVARTWGRKGTADGEFSEAWGIAVASDGSVFVTDTWNHRVQKFDSEGRFLLKWGQFQDVGSQADAEPGKFYGPRDLAIDGNGNVLVMDTGNERIQAFDQQGRFLRMVGRDGSEPGQFREPVGIALDADGRVYVADTWNQRIQVLSGGFEPLAQYPVPQWASQSATHKPYLAVLPSGDVLATVPERGGLVRLHDGAVTSVVPSSGPGLTLPIGIQVAGNRVFVADAQAGVIVAYDIAEQAPLGENGAPSTG